MVPPAPTALLWLSSVFAIRLFLYTSQGTYILSQCSRLFLSQSSCFAPHIMYLQMWCLQPSISPIEVYLTFSPFIDKFPGQVPWCVKTNPNLKSCFPIGWLFKNESIFKYQYDKKA